MQEIVKKLISVYTTSFPEQDRKINRRPKCVTQNTRISSLQNSCLTGPKLTALLYSSHNTSVLVSTVKRLWNAGQQVQFKRPGYGLKTVL